MAKLMTFDFKPIGVIRSCFKEKFGIPRQAGIVAEAPGTLVFEKEFASADAVREIERFSHLWILFVFHQAKTDHWQPLVRPPRLGGNRKVGVFASRSPFRPNPIGMSAVSLERVKQTDEGPVLHLKGVDMVDGTPVVDIKPYIPYADAVADAQGGFADAAPEAVFTVCFSETADAAVKAFEKRIPELRSLIVHMLENDPRPAYFENTQTDPNRIFGIRLFDWDVKWQVAGDCIHVLSLDTLENKP